MEILLASNNKNKHKELLKIFQEFGSKHTLIVNEDIPDVIEDKNTIEENAKKKAEECYEFFKSPIISDDSGLFVDALDGQPGVHSKRYAGLSSTDVDPDLFDRAIFVYRMLMDTSRVKTNIVHFKTTSTGHLSKLLLHERAQRGDTLSVFDTLYILHDERAMLLQQ